MRNKFNVVLPSVLAALFLLLFVSCSKDKATDPAAPVPVLITAAASAITQTTAASGGTITSDGGATVTARGVCWSTNATPTVANRKTTNGAGIGSFTSYISGLTAGTPYYVRAYATNSGGTGYGSTVWFTTLITVTDIDGNIYETVTIGTQVWMAENLKVTHYRNGEDIPNVTDNGAWIGLTTGAYCNYGDNLSNGDVYGRLYNWYAIGDGRQLAPAGWHVPTDTEWKQLEMHLGMSQSQANLEDLRGTDEGGKIKETGTTHWRSPNTGATNESGFSALPGGMIYINGYFVELSSQGCFWSSTQSSNTTAFCRFLYSNESRIGRYDFNKPSGFSVRCIKD